MKHFFLVSSISIVFILLIIFLILNNKFSKKIYERDYLGKIGIKSSFFYSDVINSMGMPISENEFQDGQDYLNLNYKGCVLSFKKKSSQNKEKFFLMNIKVTGAELRFGKSNIGIGSSMDDVDKAYKGIKKIKDIDSGYIDEGTWIEFEFDHEKKVNSILIYFGP
ncbi:MAG: hypothetical protein Q8942_19625 [Bacillota bacterium]|nr:hypothetical protein [Bacillota bacterium]